MKRTWAASGYLGGSAPFLPSENIAMRIVVFCEGTAESGALRRSFVSPNQPLPEEQIGPAHLLVQRCISREWGLTRDDMQFTSPPLLVSHRRNPRLPVGSDLRTGKNLIRLLRAWVREADVPDLALILIDQDGDRQIRTELQNAIRADSPCIRWILAVAIEEFESWLLADASALSQVFSNGARIQRPEELGPRRAKTRITGFQPIDPTSTLPTRHRRIVELMDLEIVREACPSFADFLRDLKALNSASM